MTKCIVVIEDKKAGTLENPICLPNVVVANRYLNQIATNPDSPIAKWPEDFRLVKIADYDDQTGIIQPHKPIVVAEAISFYTEKKTEKKKKK